MTKKIFYKAAFALICFFSCCQLEAQQGVQVSAIVNRNKIFIGQPLNLTLIVEVPENEAIRFFSIDTIDHFEFLDVQKIDTSNTSTGTKLIQTFRITSFDSGHWVIPPFMLAGNLATDSIPIDVVFSDFNPNQPYHDIKDVVDVIPDEKKQWWWWAVGGGLLLALVLWLVLRKKSAPVQKKQAIPTDPYKDAMEALDKLQAQRPEVKQYYSSLVDIFRQYIFQRKGIESLRETTDDLVLQLKTIQLPTDSLNQLAQSLRLADFVKFAKYQPGEEDNMQTMAVIRKSINEVEKTITQINPAS